MLYARVFCVQPALTAHLCTAELGHCVHRQIKTCSWAPPAHEMHFMALLRQFLTTDVPCACGDNDSGDNTVWRLRGPRRFQPRHHHPATSAISDAFPCSRVLWLCLLQTRSPCTQVSLQLGDPGFTLGCPGAELTTGAPWGTHR